MGIADYPGESMDLTLPVKDARTITWVYSKNSKMKYTQLLNKEATASKIIAAMNKVFSLAGEDDVVVLFYSGHGYAGGFYTYDGALSYEEIKGAISKCKAKNKIIFADACYSGKIRDNRISESSGNIQGIKNANVLLFLSSRTGEQSFERRDMNNGYFTHYLQKGLRGGADFNKDRIITAKELFNYVHKSVVSASNEKQHPVMWGRFSDDMPIITW